MRKIDFSRVMAAIAIVIGILTIIAFVNYYFVKPVMRENEKKEVLAEEKFELELLTMAYLDQNVGLAIDDNSFNEAISSEYKVAAEYYYLKNGKDHLNEYDEILSVAKILFNSRKVKFSNFVINTDDGRCGKEKYSTLEGTIYSSNCDPTAIIYEIITTYYQNYEYVVEFYAANAVQEQIESPLKCNDFELPFSYSLQLTDLEKNLFYDKTHSKCCTSECSLEGIKPLKDEILSQIKSNGSIYKMIFKKANENFVFSKIKKA